jgi:hypothetical protein
MARRPRAPGTPARSRRAPTRLDRPARPLPIVLEHRRKHRHEAGLSHVPGLKTTSRTAITAAIKVTMKTVRTIGLIEGNRTLLATSHTQLASRRGDLLWPIACVASDGRPRPTSCPPPKPPRRIAPSSVRGPGGLRAPGIARQERAGRLAGSRHRGTRRYPSPSTT